MSVVKHGCHSLNVSGRPFFWGFLGVLLGYGASAIMGSFGLNTSISLNSVTLAFAVSVAIGIIFGYYPAHRAARLSPMEDLRYE